MSVDSPQRAYTYRQRHAGEAMLSLVPTKTRTGRRCSEKPRQRRVEIRLLVLLFSYTFIVLVAVALLGISKYNVVYYRNYPRGQRDDLSQDERANGKPRLVVESKRD